MKRDQFKEALKQINEIDDQVNKHDEKPKSEEENLGQYSRLYPFEVKTEEDQQRFEVYEKIKEYAYEKWKIQTGANKKGVIYT